MSQKNTVSLIPARMGSKGVPGKNWKEINGKPLIAWTIEAALNCQYIDKVIVSTDDKTIMEISRSYGLEVIERSQSESSDTASAADVIRHAIAHLRQYKNLIYLQPTSPLRRQHTIDEALYRFKNMKNGSLVSLTYGAKPLEWTFKLSKSNQLIPQTREEIFNRQEAEPYYFLNGALYISDLDELVKNDFNLVRDDSIGFVMSKLESIDIDDEFDFEVAEYFLRKASEKGENYGK
jgi:CMP-N,N'-diacetyllegionaminic acid synthase